MKKIQINKKFDVFVEYVEHVYDFYNKNKHLEYGVYSDDKPKFYGFKRARTFSYNLIEAVDNGIDWLWQEDYSKKEWTNLVFSYTGYNFWEEFVRK